MRLPAPAGGPTPTSYHVLLNPRPGVRVPLRSPNLRYLPKYSREQAAVLCVHYRTPDKKKIVTQAGFLIWESVRSTLSPV